MARQIWQRRALARLFVLGLRIGRGGLGRHRGGTRPLLPRGGLDAGSLADVEERAARGYLRTDEIILSDGFILA